MSNNPNILIEERLEIIQNQIVRLAFLHSHLKNFKNDKDKIDSSSLRQIEGATLFYYYSFSQFILEINKLFDSNTDQHYTIPKLLNYIESNIKYVKWSKSKVTYPKPTEQEHEPGKVVWVKGKRMVWQERATGSELNKRKEMISELKLRIKENQDDLDKIEKVRNKFIAHLDKDFQKHNFSIKLEMPEKLLLLAHEIFNVLNQELRDSTLSIQHIASSTLSTLLPIEKYYQLKHLIFSTRLGKQQTVSLEELKKIVK